MLLGILDAFTQYLKFMFSTCSEIRFPFPIKCLDILLYMLRGISKVASLHRDQDIYFLFILWVVKFFSTFYHFPHT